MLTRLDLRGVTGDLQGRLPRPSLGGEGPVSEVRAIIADVRVRGDEAVRELTARFDGVRLGDLRVPPDRVRSALGQIAPDLREALGEAYQAIEAFHQHRRASPGRYERRGIVVHDLARPVDRAGLYAPGGRAQYPSTVLMTAVPARVAGVAEVTLCVPPGPDGEIPVAMLAAAALAGVDEVYRVGGAQAIAALAYGTESIAAVDVIAGPGSKYVSIAQREVAGVVGVPASFAGPSEVVVVADATTPPELAAIDLVVQAEHGPDGLAWLITWSEDAADAISAEVARLVGSSPRRAEIESTLAAGGYAVLVDGVEQAMAVANLIAPEHLELCNADPAALLPLVRSAGAVFVGVGSPASIGDYVAGPSHVLPTFGSARYASALGVEDFVKRIHAVEVTPEGLRRVGTYARRIAEAEGLFAHAESVALRCRGAAGASELVSEQGP